MKIKFEGLCPHCQKGIELIRDLPQEVIDKIKTETNGNPPVELEEGVKPAGEAPAQPSGGVMPKPDRDPATIKTLAELFKACHADFGMQPKQVLAELNCSSQSDIAESPAQCYVNIVSVRCE